MARRNTDKPDPELIAAPESTAPAADAHDAPHPMTPVDPTLPAADAAAANAPPPAAANGATIPEPTAETVARREKTGLFPYQQCNLRRGGKLCGSWNTTSRSTTIIDGDRGTRMHVRHRWCHDCNAAYKAVSRLPAETD